MTHLMVKVSSATDWQLAVLEVHSSPNSTAMTAHASATCVAALVTVEMAPCVRNCVHASSSTVVLAKDSPLPIPAEHAVCMLFWLELQKRTVALLVYASSGKSAPMSRGAAYTLPPGVTGGSGSGRSTAV